MTSTSSDDDGSTTGTYEPVRLVKGPVWRRLGTLLGWMALVDAVLIGTGLFIKAGGGEPSTLTFAYCVAAAFDLILFVAARMWGLVADLVTRQAVRYRGPVGARMVVSEDSEGGTSRWVEIQLPDFKIKTSAHATLSALWDFPTTLQPFHDATVVYSRGARELIAFRAAGSHWQVGDDGL